MKIYPLGDAAVTLDFSDETRDRSKLLNRALSASAALERANIAGVTEIVSAYQTVTLFLDLPKLTAKDQVLDELLAQKISSVLASKKKRAAKRPQIHEIPVCYEEEFALDLARIAQHTGLSPKEIVTRHSAPAYRVAAIGFLPGFPYLLGLDEKLEVPRLNEPRLHVPAGSVAIAARQAGIYPIESPGGWNIIGRTPQRLFDVAANPPALLRAGDSIRFRQISRSEFERI